MKYISDLSKYNKIKQLADQGDEQAKDFLFNFMEMDDEQANAYLSSIAVDEENPQGEDKQGETDWKDIVQALIDDENEAIDGYDKAIKYISNCDLPELVKTAYLEKLNHIKSEEIEHIEELKGII